MSHCVLCGYQCTSDDYCAGCGAFICGKHPYHPGAGPHRPEDHTADADGRRPGE